MKSRDNAGVTDNEQSGAVRRLELRLDRRPGGRDGSGYPTVTILVDGEEIFARVDDSGYVGCHPRDILNPDEAPLLPAQPARRAALYGLDSLWGAGEGCIAALILDRGDQVAWTDIRNYLGVYPLPATEDPPAGWGWLVGIPDLIFDAAQYRTEVARVTADRYWETGELRTDRLLRRHLRQGREHLAGLGWKLQFTALRRAGVSRVVFQDLADEQIVVDLPAGQGTPEERARAMADFLLTTPSAGWPMTHCSRCDSDTYRADLAAGRVSAPSRHPEHGPSSRGK
jgi:hypothetical protein